MPVLHEPTWERLRRLAHLLGTSADDLLGGVYVVEEAPPPRGPLRRAVLAAVCRNADDYPQAEYFDLVTAFLVRAFLEDAGAVLRRARLEVR